MNRSCKADYISRQLLDIIQGGNMPKGARLPAASELATRLGVSYVTICNSLKKLQAEGWVRRVNGVGTFVSRRESGVKRIGIPLRVEDNPFFLSVYEALSTACKEAGVEIILGDGMQEDKFIDRLAAEKQGVAMIRFPSNPRQEFTLQRKLVETGMRAVILNDWWHHGGSLPCVNSDESGAVEILLDHLYERGHRQIALLDDAYASQRIEAHDAFVRWHWKRNLQIIPEQVLYFCDKKCRENVLGLKSHGITAIASLFDILAFKAMDILTDAGVSIPGDIGIVSMDGTSQARERRMTFMRQKTDEMVRKAMSTALSDDYPSFGFTQIASELCVGESVSDLREEVSEA